MPIFEYVCNKCSHKIEKIQRIDDPPLGKCPECLKGDMKKTISTGSFNLKGEGFHKQGIN